MKRDVRGRRGKEGGRVNDVMQNSFQDSGKG